MKTRKSMNEDQLPLKGIISHRNIFRRKLILIMPILFLTLGINEAFSDSSAGPVTSIEIRAINLPGLIQKDQRGAYDLILKEVTKTSGQTIRFTIYSAAKRLLYGILNENTCAMGLDINHLDGVTNEQKEELIGSLPFNGAKIYIFTRSGEKIISKFSATSSLIIGARRGVSYGKEFENFKKNYPKKIIEANSNESLISLLSIKRVNAIMGYVPDIFGYYDKNEDFPLLNYDQKSPIVLYRDTIVCPKTQSHQKFIKLINGKLKILRASGKLKKIMGKLYLDF